MERRELLRLRSQRLTYPATFNPQIVRACLAGFAIGDELKRNLVAFIQVRQSSALDSADVHEHVLAAVVGLDETISLLTVEPLHCTCRHSLSLRYQGPRSRKAYRINAAAIRPRHGRIGQAFRRSSGPRQQVTNVLATSVSAAPAPIEPPVEQER